MDSALKPTESPAAALVFESMQVPWVMPKHVVLTRVFKFTQMEKKWVLYRGNITGSPAAPSPVASPSGLTHEGDSQGGAGIGECLN